jgi:superfamily II DNA helicase RecQ
VDYREILNAADFAVFSGLRVWRKAAAEKEGIPVYAVLTNDQLAQLARQRPTSKEALRGIEGIGEAKAARYAEGMLQIIGGSVSPSAPPEAGAV